MAITLASEGGGQGFDPLLLPTFSFEKKWISEAV
jgi:chromate transport protein ChrA